MPDQVLIQASKDTFLGRDSEPPLLLMVIPVVLELVFVRVVESSEKAVPPSELPDLMFGLSYLWACPGSVTP